MSLDSYLSALNDYVQTNENIISTLKSIHRDVDVDRKGHRAIKTIGTGCGVISAASTVGVLFAPLTGGLSLALPAVAAATAVGGLTAAVGGGVAHHYVNKSHAKKIEEQQQKHVRTVERLNEEIKKLEKIIEQLTNEGYSVEMATISTLICLANNLFEVGKGVKDIAAAAKTIDVCIKSAKVTDLLANAGVTVTTRVAANGARGYSVAFQSLNAVQKATDSQMKAFSQLGRNPELLGMGMKAVRTLAVVGVVFTVVDVTLLIKGWNDPDPLQKAINEFISKLDQDLKAKRNHVKCIEFLKKQ